MEKNKTFQGLKPLKIEIDKLDTKMISQSSHKGEIPPTQKPDQAKTIKKELPASEDRNQHLQHQSKKGASSIPLPTEQEGPEMVQCFGCGCALEKTKMSDHWNQEHLPTTSKRRKLEDQRSQTAGLVGRAAKKSVKVKKLKRLAPREVSSVEQTNIEKIQNQMQELKSQMGRLATIVQNQGSSKTQQNGDIGDPNHSTLTFPVPTPLKRKREGDEHSEGSSKWPRLSQDSQASVSHSKSDLRSTEQAKTLGTLQALSTKLETCIEVSEQRAKAAEEAMRNAMRALEDSNQSLNVVKQYAKEIKENIKKLKGSMENAPEEPVGLSLGPVPGSPDKDDAPGPSALSVHQDTTRQLEDQSKELEGVDIICMEATVRNRNPLEPSSSLVITLESDDDENDHSEAGLSMANNRLPPISRLQRDIERDTKVFEIVLQNLLREARGEEGPNVLWPVGPFPMAYPNYKGRPFPYGYPKPYDIQLYGGPENKGTDRVFTDEHLEVAAARADNVGDPNISRGTRLFNDLVLSRLGSWADDLDLVQVRNVFEKCHALRRAANDQLSCDQGIKVEDWELFLRFQSNVIAEACIYAYERFDKHTVKPVQKKMERKDSICMSCLDAARYYVRHFKRTLLSKLKKREEKGNK